MAKLLFDYVTAIDTQIVGNEIDPRIAINIETRVAQGVYFNRTKRLDTGEERTEYERPISFSIQLTPEDMQAMLAPCLVRAAEQDVLRPATPVLTEPPAPIPDPAPTVTVEVIPATAEVAANGTVQLNVVVSVPEGGTVEVEWFVRTGDLGTVIDGLYTAPATPGLYRVLARSLQDNSTVGYCDVTVI